MNLSYVGAISPPEGIGSFVVSSLGVAERASDCNWLVVYAKSLELRATLYNAMDCSLPGSSIQGILQARILKWVIISYSRGSS